MARLGPSPACAPPLWLLCGFLGFGLLWPWQVVLNSLPVVLPLLPSQPGLAYFAAVAFNTPQLPAQLLALAFGHLTPGALRLRGGFGILALALAALPLAVAARARLGAGAAGEQLAAELFYLCCAAAGAGTAVVESALFGQCAMMGASAGAATQAVLAGEAVAALAANAVQLLSQAAPAGEQAEVLGAGFYGSAALMLVCAAAAGLLADPKAGGDLAEEEQAPLVVAGAASGARDAELAAPSKPPAAAAAPQSFLASLADGLRLGRDLLLACWRTCLCIFVNMAILFAVFPGVVAGIAYADTMPNATASRLLAANGGAAWTLLLFGLFAVADLLGRLLAGLRWCGGPGACRRGLRGEALDPKTFASRDVEPDDGDDDRDRGERRSLIGVRAKGGATPPARKRSIFGGYGALDEAEAAAAAAGSGGRGEGEGEGGDGSGWAAGSGRGGALASAAQRLGWRAPFMRRVLLIEALTWARLVAFVPLLVLAARGELRRAPESDFVVAVVVLLFGLSNGHVPTLTMIAGPGLVAPQHRGSASVLHVFFLIAGLWCGSLLGAALQPLARPGGA